MDVPIKKIIDFMPIEWLSAKGIAGYETAGYKYATIKNKDGTEHWALALFENQTSTTTTE